MTEPANIPLPGDHPVLAQEDPFIFDLPAAERDNRREAFNRILAELHTDDLRMVDEPTVARMHSLLRQMLSTGEPSYDKYRALWSAAFGDQIPERWTLALAEEEDEEDDPNVIVTLTGDSVDLVQIALRRLNAIDPSPRGRGYGHEVHGNGFLMDDTLAVVRRQIGKLYFPGFRGTVRQRLVADFERALALKLAHTGTSPQLDTDDICVELIHKEDSRLINASVFLDWLIEGCEGEFGATSLLRRYARTALAIFAWRQLRKSRSATPFVSKYGLDRNARAVAFDFSDGVPDHFLSAAEHRGRAKLRRVAISRADQDSFIDDAGSNVGVL